MELEVVPGKTEREYPVTSVTIATPAYTGRVTVEFMNSLAKTITDLGYYKIPWRMIAAVGDSLIARSRNTLTAMFLESDSSHLMFLDDDMAFPGWGVRKLLFNDKAIVGTAYKTRKVTAPKYTCSFFDNEEKTVTIEGKTGCCKVKNIATGCVLMHRSIFETLIKNEVVIKYDIEESFDKFNKWNYLFYDVGVINGKYWGEDFGLCNKLRDAGIDIWLDTTFTPGHVAQTVMEGDIKEIFKKKEEAHADIQICGPASA